MKNKIIQICTGTKNEGYNHDLYALDEEGNVYYWTSNGWKLLEEQND